MSVFFSRVRKVSDILSSNNFYTPFSLFLLGPLHLNVSMLDVVPEVS